MLYTFIRNSGNRKTGPIPVTYNLRKTCPPSCGLYRAGCYGDDFHTRMSWDKVPARGVPVQQLAGHVQSLPPGQVWRLAIVGDLPGEGEKVDPYELGVIVKANKGRRGFTYTHKHTPEALSWVKHANAWGFCINLSADNAGHADQLADTGAGPVVAVVPMDTPKTSHTPGGRLIVVCEAQTRDEITCESCGNFNPWCSRSDRDFVVGFRAHGSKAKQTDKLARKVIPILAH